MMLILTLILAFLTNYLLLFYKFGAGFFVLMLGYTLYVCYSLYLKKVLMCRRL